MNELSRREDEVMITHEGWLDLHNKALDLATSKAIPESILDSYTRSRLTDFLFDHVLEARRLNGSWPGRKIVD